MQTTPYPRRAPISTALRSYRATMVPQGIATDELEVRSEKGNLPTLQVRAINALWAESAAHHLSGLPVLKVERIEVAA